MLCKSVLKSLVVDLDKTSFNVGMSIPDIISALVTAHPELAFPEEDWNKISEETRASIIEKTKITMQSIQ
jgi:hypothetical protein